METNDKIKLAAAALIGIFFIGMARRLTAGMRERAQEREEKEQQKEKIEIYETTTSSANPFNDTKFLNEAVAKKVIVNRLADGGKQKARELYGYFGVFNEDETKIIDFFRRLNSQYQVAQISKSMREIYKKSLLELMREGVPTFFFQVGNGLSTEDINKVFVIVSKLPKYK